MRLLVTTIVSTITLISAAGCGLSAVQRQEIRQWEKQAADLGHPEVRYTEEFSPGTAAALGLLPFGVGGFYVERPGLGVSGILCWPLSITWVPAVASSSAHHHNYDLLRSKIEALKEQAWIRGAREQGAKRTDAISAEPRADDGPSAGAVAGRDLPVAEVTRPTVQVREIGVKNARVTNYSGDLSGYGQRLSQRIAEQLRRKGIPAVTTARDVPAAGAVVVEGEVTEVDGGSRTARWLVPGVGAGRVEVRGRILDAEGRLVSEFASEDGSGWGLFGGDTREIVEEDGLEGIAADIAEKVADQHETRAWRR